MTHEMLTAAGIENKQGRYKEPSRDKTYAVYFDDVDKEGADRVPTPYKVGLPRIVHHSVSVELYEPRPDPEAESAFEAQLDAQGLDWSKQDRLWIQSEQRYQVVYSYNYTEKT